MSIDNPKQQICLLIDSERLIYGLSNLYDADELMDVVDADVRAGLAEEAALLSTYPGGQLPVRAGSPPASADISEVKRALRRLLVDPTEEGLKGPGSSPEQTSPWSARCYVAGGQHRRRRSEVWRHLPEP